MERKQVELLRDMGAEIDTREKGEKHGDEEEAEGSSEDDSES